MLQLTEIMSSHVFNFRPRVSSLGRGFVRIGNHLINSKWVKNVELNDKDIYITEAFGAITRAGSWQYQSVAPSDAQKIFRFSTTEHATKTFEDLSASLNQMSD